MISSRRETSRVPEPPDGCLRVAGAEETDLEWIVDRMTKDDLPSILEIERDSQEDPWTEKLFLEELSRPRGHVLVARATREKTNLLGYICFWEVADELQILNVSVHASYRRRGIGRCLLREALIYGKTRKVKVALLEVRQTNVAAREFYETLGFRTVGERPDYYGPGKSAILMELDLVDLSLSSRE